MISPSASQHDPEPAGGDAGEKFDRILNFRDVGRTVNRVLGESLFVEGLFYRSARPDDATRADRKRLLHDLSISTIIDLRTKTEHLEQARKREADLNTPSVLRSNEALSGPVKISGISYREINLNGRGFELYMVKKLPFFSLLKMAFLMLFGYRTKAISIFGTKIMKPRGLVGLGLDTLKCSGPEIAEAIRVFADPANYPIMVHCTQGKDRTGLIVGLILFLLDAPVRAVDHDYMLSQAELIPERADRVKDMELMGLDESFADCAPGWMKQLHEYLEQEHGGAEGYLTHIGVTKEEVMRIREILQG